MQSFIYLEPLCKPTRGEIYNSMLKHGICWRFKVFGSPGLAGRFLVSTVDQTTFKSTCSFVVVLLLKYFENIFRQKCMELFTNRF